MDDIQVKDGELKALLRFAKNKPVNFAFNPSKDKTAHFFAAHKRQPGAKLGKAAKAEGESKKVAFGTFTVDGKMMLLTCERVVPKLAKDMKAFLKSNKLSMNVTVLDENGTEVESDVEALPPDENDETAAPEAPATAAATDPQADTGALKKRIVAVQQALTQIEGENGQKLLKALKVAATLLAKGDAEKASAALDQIESGLARLQPSDAKQGETAAPDIDSKALLQRLNGLSAQIKALEGPMAAKLLAALQKVAAAFKGGKLAAASKGADQIEAALAKLGNAAAPAATAPSELDANAKKAVQVAGVMHSRGEALPDSAARTAFLTQVAEALAQAEAGEGEAAIALLRPLQVTLKELEAAPAEAPDTSEESPSKEEMAWFAAFMRLENDVNAALTKGLVRDVDGLRADWNWATAEGGDGRYAEALAKIPDVERHLADRLEGDATAFSEEIGDDVKPFAEARLNWRDARGAMGQELGKLQSAIVAECGGDPELQVVADHVDDLTMHISELDNRLETALDKIVNAAGEEARGPLKVSALKLLEDYEAELKKPFFEAVDENNGFANVRVAATARAALSGIGNVLRG